MTAQEIYEKKTGRESHSRHGFARRAYVEWLERIVERVAGMMNVVPSDKSIYDHDDLEELYNLFSRIV